MITKKIFHAAFYVLLFTIIMILSLSTALILVGNSVDKEVDAYMKSKNLNMSTNETITITLQVKLYDSDGSNFVFKTYTKSYEYGTEVSLSDFDFEMNSDIGHSMSAAGNYEFIGYYNGTSKIDTITATSDITLEARWEVYSYATLSNGTQQIKVYFKEDKLYDLSLYVSSLVAPEGQDFIGWSLENDVTKLISNTQIDKATYAGKTIYAIFHEPVTITLQVKLYDDDGSNFIFKTYTKSYKYGATVSLSDFDSEMNSDIGHSMSAAGNYEFIGYYNDTSKIDTITATSDITLEARWEVYKYATLSNGTQQIKVYFKEDKLYDLSLYVSSLVAPEGQDFIGWSLENDVTKLISNTQIDKATYAGKTIYAVFHEPVILTLSIMLIDSCNGSSSTYKTYKDSYKYGTIVDLNESYMQRMESDIGHSISAAGNYFFSTFQGASNNQITMIENKSITAQWKEYKYASIIGYNQTIKAYFKDNNAIDLEPYISSLILPEGKDFIWFSSESNFDYDGESVITSVYNNENQAYQAVYAVFHEPVDLTIKATLLRYLDDGTTDSGDTRQTIIENIKFGSVVNMSDYVKEIKDLFPGIDCEVGPTLGPSGGGGPSTISEFVIKGNTTVDTVVYDNRAILTSRYFFEGADFDYMALDGLFGKSISGLSKGEVISESTIKEYIDSVISEYSVIAASKINSKILNYPDVITYKVYTDYNCTNEYLGGEIICDRSTNFLYVNIIKDKYIVEFVVKDDISNPIFYSYVSKSGESLRFPDQNYDTFYCVTNSTFGTGNKYKFIGWTLSECSMSDWDANKRDYDYISPESNIVVDQDLTIYASNYKYSILVATWSSKFVYDGDETVSGNLWNNIVDGAKDLLPENLKKWLIGIGVSLAVVVVLIIIIKLVKK